MRPFNVKLWGCIGIMCVVAMIIGCGGGDLLDETTQRYSATISVKDLDEDTLTVDAVRNYCGQSNTPEEFGDATASITVNVAKDALGVILKNYVLEYIPLESEDGSGAVVMPPALDGPLTGGNSSVIIVSGGNRIFEITCMSADTKDEFRRKIGWIYYTEDPLGYAAILDKEAEVAAKKVEIANKQQEIADALAVDNSADTSGLELQLATLEVELTHLEAELDALPYTFWSVPDLWSARYKIRVTLNFEDSEGQDRAVVAETTVWLGPYDNC